MSYQHGVYVQEVASRVVATANVDAGLPVVIGTAIKSFSTPKLLSSYDEAVEACGGYIGVNANGVHDFTLCEFIKVYFQNANLGNAIFINVFKPSKHIADGEALSKTVALSDGEGVLDVANAVIQSISVNSTAASEGVDYNLTYSANGYANISRISTSTVISADSSLSISYKVADFTKIDATDITAGINLVEDIYPQTLLVPGQLVCPRYSCFPSIATKLKNAAASVGGVYECIALCDIPTANDSLASGGAGSAETVTGITSYDSVVAAKQVSHKDVNVCWPMAVLGAELYHGSSVLAATICQTDANASIPYASPSNHSANVSGAALKNGTRVWLKAPQANILNAGGVVTLLATSAGWVIWGNRTSAYNSSTDAKDSFISVRRMMNYVGNTLINSFFQKVDAPLNKAQIEAVVDSANIWLNGLVGGGYLVEGKVEFREQDNTSISLSDGIANFRVTLCPPSPNRAIVFTLEYDALAYSALFE